MSQNYESITGREYSKFVESPSRPGESATEVVDQQAKNVLDAILVALGSATTQPQNLIITTGLANVEIAITLPVGTKIFRLKSRKLSRLRLAYALNGTVSNYFTLPPGSDFLEPYVGLATQIFISCDKPSQVIELICYG